MVAWWSGDGHPNDSFGTNHGRLAAGTQYAPAVFGSGFSFDGVDDRVEIADTAALKLTQSLSLSAWIFPKKVPGPATRAQICFRGDNRNGFDPYSLSLHNGELTFLLESLTRSAVLTAPITPGRYYHVAATLDDATGWIRLYLNGVVVAEQTTSVRPFRDLDPAWQPGISIGDVPNYPNPYHFQPFSGTIDEVKIYNRARTGFEIADEYAAGLSESLLVTGFESDRVARFDAGNGTFMGEAPADLPNFPDPGLTADTVYTYRVRATGTAGHSAFSAEATLPTPPLAPSGLGITVPAPRQLALTWTDNSQSETGFKIQRRTSSGVFTLAGTVSPGVTSFLDTGVAAGVTYTYQIRATNAGGDSAPSASVMRLTLPATPTNLTVTPFSSTQLDLNWTDGNPSPPPIKVERSTDGVNYSPVTVTPGASTSYRDNALTPETTYHYRIRTTNASGDSAPSLAASGRTFPPQPASPGALVAVAVSGRSVQLTWQDRSSNEAGFEVWRLGPTGPYQRVTFAPANSTAHLDRLDLSGLTSYLYRVRAINDGGGSTFIQSNPVTTPADVPEPPASPGAVSLSSSQIRITWVDASDNESAFQVERKPAGGSFTLATTTAGGATEFVDGSRAESAAYTYRVIAVNAQGSSPPSAEVTATTRPAAPGGLAATAGNRKVDLSWADNSALETGFRIERKDSANAFAPLHTVAAGVRAYSDATVTAGVSYTYRVLATSASGDSVPSNESTAIPRNETPLAKLVVTPRTVSFGTLRLGKSGKRTFKLTNKGKEALSGSVGAVNAPFILISGGGAFTLAPKKSRVVTVTWTPTAAGSVAGAVEVTSTDPRMLKVDVRLTGKTR